jgi:hypothetical protein
VADGGGEVGASEPPLQRSYRHATSRQPVNLNNTGWNVLLVVLCVLRYRVGAYGDGNRLSLNRLDSQVHAHMSRNLRAIEQYKLFKYARRQ